MFFDDGDVVLTEVFMVEKIDDGKAVITKKPILRRSICSLFAHVVPLSDMSNNCRIVIFISPYYSEFGADGTADHQVILETMFYTVIGQCVFCEREFFLTYLTLNVQNWFTRHN